MTNATAVNLHNVNGTWEPVDGTYVRIIGDHPGHSVLTVTYSGGKRTALTIEAKHLDWDAALRFAHEIQARIDA